jgi:hypothetical protein
MNQQLLAMMFWKKDGNNPELNTLRVFAIVLMLVFSAYMFYLAF